MYMYKTRDVKHGKMLTDTNVQHIRRLTYRSHDDDAKQQFPIIIK